MKKIFLYSLMLGMSVFGLSSCNDDNDELTDSRVTYYVNLDMQGDAFVQVPIGTSYSDAGCLATENGEDVTSKIVTSGIDEIDVNAAGLYTVTYSAVNKDGFPASVSRTVAVCDPSITTDISGTWTVQAGSYRLYNGAQTPYADFTVRIRRDAPGIFYVSDFLAGWYDQRAGYGSSYACRGYVQLLEDGTLVCLDSFVPGWSDSLEDFEGSYDEATGTITWDATYTNYPFVFHAILN